LLRLARRACRAASTPARKAGAGVSLPTTGSRRIGALRVSTFRPFCARPSCAGECAWRIVRGRWAAGSTTSNGGAYVSEDDRALRRACCGLRRREQECTDRGPGELGPLAGSLHGALAEWSAGRRRDPLRRE